MTSAISGRPPRELSHEGLLDALAAMRGGAGPAFTPSVIRGSAAWPRDGWSVWFAGLLPYYVASDTSSRDWACAVTWARFATERDGVHRTPFDEMGEALALIHVGRRYGDRSMVDAGRRLAEGAVRALDPATATGRELYAVTAMWGLGVARSEPMAYAMASTRWRHCPSVAASHPRVLSALTALAGDGMQIGSLLREDFLTQVAGLPTAASDDFWLVEACTAATPGRRHPFALAREAVG